MARSQDDIIGDVVIVVEQFIDRDDDRAAYHALQNLAEDLPRLKAWMAKRPCPGCGSVCYDEHT